MRHIKQQSHGHKTYALAAAIHLTTFKTRKESFRNTCVMFVRCTAIVWIAFCRVRIMCMSTILRRLDATIKTHTPNARARATYARTCAKRKSNDKVL